MLNSPNNNGPPWVCSNSNHMCTKRATSARTAGLSRQISAPCSGKWASMFMGQLARKPIKPECISAQMLRAWARAAASRGHRCLSGNISARVSAIANVSHTASAPLCNTGTLPAGLIGPSVCLNCDSGVKASKRTITSSNAMPAWVISTQGRMDQDE